MIGQILVHSVSYGENENGKSKEFYHVHVLTNQISCPLHICPALPCSMLSYHKVSCFQIYTDLKSLGVIAKTIQLGLRQDSDRIVDLQSDSEAKAEREKEDEVDGVICTDRYSKLLKTFWDGLKHRYNSLVSNLLFGICDAMSRLPLCLPSLKLQKFLLNPICLLLVSWTAMRSRAYRIRKIKGKTDKRKKEMKFNKRLAIQIMLFSC